MIGCLSLVLVPLFLAGEISKFALWEFCRKCLTWNCWMMGEGAEFYRMKVI